MPLAAQPLDSQRPTESAIIVAVADAEPVVARHRDRFDTAASWGVPAHVTILYPFIDPAALNKRVVERLRDAVRRVDPFRCVFNRTAWFGTDVLWLAPEPDMPFRLLTGAVVQAFPTHLPYGGAYGADATPHLTVAETRLADRVEDVLAAEREVEPLLPIATTVSEALLIAGTASADSWGVVARLRLGS